MWMLFARAPKPDAPYWQGRRALALVDAVSWPAALAIGAVQMPMGTGLFGQVWLVACALAATLRVRRALLTNHRYRFTTASALGAVAFVLAVGAMLKLAL
jgi:hypothetical protein